MQTIIARLQAEPVVVRAFIAALLDLLAVLGVLDTPVLDSIELTVLALLNVLLLVSARSNVSPYTALDAEDVDDDADADPLP